MKRSKNYENNIPNFNLQRRANIIAEVTLSIGINNVKTLVIYENENVDKKIELFIRNNNLVKNSFDVIKKEVVKQISHKMKYKKQVNKSASPTKVRASKINKEIKTVFDQITKNFLRSRIKEHKKKSKSPISKDEVYKLKLVKYKYMFDQLDSDRDGKISTQKINLCALDLEVLEAITPILKELQKERKTMDFKQFAIEVDQCLAIKIYDENV